MGEREVAAVKQNFASSLTAVLVHEATKRQVTNYVPKNARAYTCAHGTCDSRAYAKGLCNAHYIRLRAGADMDAPIKHRTANALCTECDKPLDGKAGWGLCRAHYKRRRRAAIKAFFVEQKGGCCSACFGVFPLAAYDFHHLGDKDASIGNLIDGGSVESIEAEMSKCILLCANCHRIEHNGAE
jgi:hypothetical protein